MDTQPAFWHMVSMYSLQMVLDKESRQLLLRYFPPRFTKVLADHITLQYDAPYSEASFKGTARVFAQTTGDTVQAAWVELDGATSRMFCGKKPHITVSVAEGAEARQSNDLPMGPHCGFCVVVTGTVKTIEH